MVDTRGIRKCPICEERCHVNQMEEGIRSHVPEIETIMVCVECYDEWRTSPEYDHLRPDYSVQEAQEIKKKREFYQKNRIWF